MEPITISIALIVAILAAALAYVFAKGNAAKRQAELDTSLKQLNEQVEQQKLQLNNQQNELKILNEQLNAKEHETTKLSAQFAHTDMLFKEEKSKNNHLEQKLEELRKAKHDAEKANESAQVSLSETNKKAETLQARLDKEESLTGSLRKDIDAEKQKLAEQSRQTKDYEVQASKAYEQVREKQSKLEELEAKLEQQRARYDSLHSEYTKLNSTLEEREASHTREVENFAKQKEELKKDFENLANKIFEEKGKTFTQTSQNSIDGMLKPFREQIEAFQKRVDTVHNESVKEGANLNAEIKKVLDIGLKMSAEANNLTSALKGDSQQRGAWGEAQLRRTLEMSGLVEDAHFEVQSSFKDADGKQKQTDYLIKLPDNKHIIIDSKVSMVAYDRAVSAETPELYKAAMDEHVKAVRKHIDDLSAKDYTNVLGMHSPSFVLMFMPIEPAYIEALKSNKDLFEYGYKKNIVLVSHTTLIPILRTVSNLWMIERSNAEAREISEKAGDIYNQVCTVAERLGKLGGTLNTANTHYNNTVKALVGQQGLYGKVDRFNQLSAKVSKSLPQLDAAHMDFETERLSMIAEPIHDIEEGSLESIAQDGDIIAVSEPESLSLKKETSEKEVLEKEALDKEG